MIFCFEGLSASRCSITSKTFSDKSQLGGHCKHFGGGQIWADTAPAALDFKPLEMMQKSLEAAAYNLINTVC